MSVTTVPGLYESIPNAEYHRGLRSDPKPLSSSMAKTIVTKSPAEFRYEQANRIERSVFDEGTAVHELVLEGGFKTIDVHDFDSWRTKEARVARDESYANNRHPLLTDAVAPLVTMADAVKKSPLAAEQFTSGRPEVSALAFDPEHGVHLQARMDWLSLPEWGADRPAIVDLKTTVMGANPRSFNREIAERRYHLSMAFYRRVLMLLGYDSPELLFVAVGKNAPHMVSVHEMSVSDRIIGDQLVNKAIATYAACLAADEWPGYDGQIHITDLPAWATYEAEEIAGPIYEGV
jgi:hypothetical protein